MYFHIIIVRNGCLLKISVSNGNILQKDVKSEEWRKMVEPFEWPSHREVALGFQKTGDPCFTLIFTVSVKDRWQFTLSFLLQGNPPWIKTHSQFTGEPSLGIYSGSRVTLYCNTCIVPLKNISGCIQAEWTKKEKQKKESGADSGRK